LGLPAKVSVPVPYAWFARAVLNLASLFNLAAVFYTVVGIAMGRIADGINRTSLMAQAWPSGRPPLVLAHEMVNFGSKGKL
jgi:hypothetical protein